MRQSNFLRPAAFLVTLHAALLVLQPVFAGLILSGSTFDALDAHRQNGRAIAVTCALAALALSAAWRRRAIGPAWPVLALVLLAAEAMQIHLGFTDALMFHVPLGVAIVAGGVLLAYATLSAFLVAGPQVTGRE